MIRSLAAVALTLAVTGCPDDPKNPERLWLALRGSETMVQLVPAEPEPF